MRLTPPIKVPLPDLPLLHPWQPSKGLGPHDLESLPALKSYNYGLFSVLQTPSFYMFMWILMDVVSAIFIFAVFYFHW